MNIDVLVPEFSLRALVTQKIDEKHTDFLLRRSEDLIRSKMKRSPSCDRSPFLCTIYVFFSKIYFLKVDLKLKSALADPRTRNSSSKTRKQCSRTIPGASLGDVLEHNVMFE